MLVDHVVWATPDIASTAARITSELGLTFVEGGSHPGFGTRNVLAGLGDGSYLELIGPDTSQPPPGRPRPFGIDELDSDRVVTWCARPRRDLGDVVGALAGAGYAAGPVSSMSRQRPDGVLLHWRLTQAVVASPWFGTVPFLIDWGATPHPAAGLASGPALQRLRLSHPDVERLRAVLAAIGTDPRIETRAGEPNVEAVIG